MTQPAPSEISCEFIHDSTVNYGMQQNCVPVVRRLRITNGSTRDLYDLSISIAADPPFTDAWTAPLACLRAGQSCDLGHVDLPLSPSYLAGLTERVHGILTVAIEAGGLTLCTQRSPIAVLAHDEWSGGRSLPEMVAAFVSPNHPAIAGILATASGILGVLTGDPSLNGYQERDYRRALAIARAIYEAIRALDVVYCVPPASFENDGQKIRPPDAIVRNKMATCLDMATLYAACAEAAGLNAMVVFIKEHAFAGVWLIPQFFAESVQDDVTQLTKRTAEGIDEIAVVELTGACSGSGLPFDRAVAAAVARLGRPHEFLYLVDIRRARAAQILPLPHQQTTDSVLEEYSEKTRRDAPAGDSCSPLPPFPWRGEGLGERGSEAPERASSRTDGLPVQVGTWVGVVGPATPLVERTRLDHWERLLLDVSLRNPLLNFRPTGSNVRILLPDLSALATALADGKDLALMPRPADWESPASNPSQSGQETKRRDATIYTARNLNDPEIHLLREEFAQRRLRTDTQASDHAARLTQLYRAARISLEENGANTLFVAVGMLVWYETDVSTRPRYSPILLLPVQLVRKSIQSGYVIRAGDDEAQVNITLIEMLRQDFDLDASEVAASTTDGPGVDVLEVLTRMRQAVKTMSRWDVLNEVQLGLFSFSKFVMWNDLKARMEVLKQNKTVSSLIAGQLTWTPNPPRLPIPSTRQATSETASTTPADPLDATPKTLEVTEETLDALVHPRDICCPISADSSQLTAIYAAGAGESFVLHGPPGTGKSQTITNIIAHSLAMGKTVLFVAEKRAALTVVQRRLKQIGIDRFCLELHSNKSNKKDVLERLGESLEAAATAAVPEGTGDGDSTANRLKLVRDELNGYVEALHTVRPIGLSVFDALSRLTALRDASGAISFAPPRIEDITAAKRAEWTGAIRRMRVAAEVCGTLTGHPWTHAHATRVTPQMLTDAAARIGELRAAVLQLRRAIPDAVKLFALPSANPSYGQVSIVAELSRLLLTAPAIPGATIATPDWEEAHAVIEQWTQHGRVRDALRQEVYERYTERALSLDLDALQATLQRAERTWFLPRFFLRRQVGKALRAVGLAKAPKTTDFAADIDCLQRLAAQEKLINAAGERARGLLGRLWKDGNPDWRAVEDATEWASSVRNLTIRAAAFGGVTAAGVRNHIASLITDRREELRPEGALGRVMWASADALATVTAAWHVFGTLLDVARAGFVKDESAAGWFDAILSHLDAWENGIGDLRDWAAWQGVRKAAIEAGLETVVTAYEGGRVAHREVERAFERALMTCWVEQTIGDEPVLHSFSRSLFEDTIREFRALDETLAELARGEVFARIAARVPRMRDLAIRPDTDSEMGVLQRELRKQRGHLALRSLFQKIPNLLPRLKPCLLVSPISVAQYLDPAQPPFDLVIFDEASQLPTCDAVGAIARGRETIIVGDPNQLGPTRFFNSVQAAEDESIASADLESILDDCLALTMPQRHLQWHYRSQHESLIAFSNHQYYKDRLLTFPSVDDLTPVVHWRPTAGAYERGGSKQNRGEAAAVVAEVVRRLRDPALRTASIGVVTFSQPQQQLIEDLLDEQLRQYPELEPFFSSDLDEPVFVKNLENVQGDERDVIIFSIGYGPDSQGRVSMNFGPLNQDGGWRRLNVAVSRARQAMYVFSTLRAEHIDLSRTNARGVADLKAFLEYAERGKSSLMPVAESEPLDLRPSAAGEEREVAYTSSGKEFEEHIADSLRARGHVVHARVGCSGYRIDLAIADPSAPGRYLLGIECDGVTYRDAKTARDRDKLRQEVLRKLGWVTHRVWSTEWYANSDRELQRIEEALRSAHHRPRYAEQPAGSQTSTARVGLSTSNTPEPARGNYTTLPLFGPHGDDDAFDGVAALGLESGVAPPYPQAQAEQFATPGSQIGAPMTPEDWGESSVGANKPAIALTGPREYAPTDVPRVERPPEEFYHSYNDGLILAQIADLVNADGPISFASIARCVVNAWGMTRVAHRIESRLRHLCDRVPCKTTRSGECVYFWPVGVSPEAYTLYRVPGASPRSRREADDIAPEEIANAAQDILSSQISLMEEDFIRETARVFGFARAGKAVVDQVRTGVALLVATNRARVESGRIVAI